MKRRLLLCLPAALAAGCAAWQRPAPADAPAQRDRALDAALRSQPLVLLGEVHDNAAQHALRAQALRRLLRTGRRPALLMEQFDREHQAALDRVLATPGATADALIAAGWPQGGAGWQWPLYRPFIELAFEFSLPLVAANVSRADTRRIIAGGLAAHGFDGAVPADIAAAQTQAIVDSHCGHVDTALAGRLMQAQVARDQFMARQLAAHAGRGAVLLAGNGHVRRDIGVPRWLPADLQARCVSIGLLEDAGPPAAYDVAFDMPAPSRPDPCTALQRRPA
ncbi:ChaN family lipoprotein [Aquincola sp. MAHUQ-54]|uniref:ChaN family lipoprotein n=1 Tax=Aquincola agrisoli TaxID=3119538 RepID=A0AAW9QDM9_9BURK